MSALGLKRVLGLFAVSFIAIGFMIGGGVFVFTGIALKITGPALPLAYALAVIPVFISTLPMAMLGSAIPSTGGNYKYPCRMFSPGIAFVGIWTYALSSFFGQIPLLANGCATYIQSFLPDIPSMTIALGLVTFFYLINLLGIKFAAITQGILVIILITALLVYGGTGLVELNPGNFNNIWQKGTGNILLGTALLTFTYFGANSIIELGGEIIDPGKIIPKAFMICFPIVAGIYILVATATVGMASFEILSESKEPLILVSNMMFKAPGRLFFILGGAIIALTTTLNAIFITGTKSLLIMIEDDLFPRSIGKISQQFKTPYRALTVFWILAILGVISRFSMETLAAYASLGALVIMVPIQLVALTFPQKYPDYYAAASFRLRGVWQFICPLTGIFIALFFGFIILVDLGSLFKIGGFILFMLSGAVYFHLRKLYLLGKNIDLNKLKNKNDWVE
ncbi:MAG: APC family permease [Desulfobacula sp.]|nr:APC family permease [Desulfobacula sp.]